MDAKKCSAVWTTPAQQRRDDLLVNGCFILIASTGALWLIALLGIALMVLSHA